ncbi:MAG: shikimate dehydrogenase [Chthoniobacterales bacterium]
MSDTNSGDTLFTADDILQRPEIFSELAPPARLAVTGHPVEHSRSPGMHNAALAHDKKNLQYIKIDLPEDKAIKTFRAMAKAGFIGSNVTIPLKAQALAACDKVDENARRMGSVNTILMENGSLTGFNTDGPGLVRAIREDFQVDLKDLRVLLLGAGGGAGRAIAVQCALEGCERLVLVNRTQEKAESLRKELDEFFHSDRLEGPGDRLVCTPWENKALRSQLENCDIIINATSIGMKRSDAAPIPSSLITPNLLVYDAVYSGGKSRLIEDSQAAGARAASGLSMLLHQGALSYEIWFDHPAPIAAMRKGLTG